MLKNCALCGKEFEATSARKYCSKECKKEKLRELARQYSRQRYRLKLQTKKCLICGKSFKGYKKNKYCSRLCANEAKRRHSRLYWIKYHRINRKDRIKIQSEGINIIQYIKTCRHCGKEFIATNHRICFCSEECRKKEKEKNQEIQKRRNRLKQKKRNSPLDERARLQKETGLPSSILEAYKDDPKKFNRVKFYYYENGLAKPCNTNEKRIIGKKS